eukprot:gnl/TRDRNA2_/TRDRNA2_184689_c0_seq1.p1 gnl/TRDRNA2_/TRDRNA2_184689_c0~~gnl/TRDRNA2_/TRDRNA2_184689_c0_seq1.p1  ORF type:complete len:470 (-),score=83.60 gnl/TRDRNA2_/TRDRNA2_184689_c0_seq1:217-1566(-)
MELSPQASRKRTLQAITPAKDTTAKCRKAKRPHYHGLSVIESSAPSGVKSGEGADERTAKVEKAARMAEAHDSTTRRTYARLDSSHGRGNAEGAESLHDIVDALELAAGFGEDYFQAPTCAKLKPRLSLLAAKPTLGDEEASQPPPEPPRAERFKTWLKLLRMGFSLLVEGLGSKRRLLEDFADEIAKTWATNPVRIDGFAAKVSLSERLREVMEQVHPSAPRAGNSVEGLGAAVRAAQRSSSRPLLLVVHNLELLPPPHQVVLAKLSATPNVHLVASVDNMWASESVVWDGHCLKDFNFVRETVRTYEDYEVEIAGRYVEGDPAWTGLGVSRAQVHKASLSLVLKSLTDNHRELVAIIAKQQLAPGGRSGISMSALLKLTSAKMIAKTSTKLSHLLTELKDHETVTVKNGQDGGKLFILPYSDSVLKKLADGDPLASDDEGDDDMEEE